MSAPRLFGLGAAGTSVAWAFLSSCTQAFVWRGSGRSRLELICEGRELKLDKQQPCGGSGPLMGLGEESRHLRYQEVSLLISARIILPQAQTAHGGIFM